VRGHKCARLFFLEAADYIVEEPEDTDNNVATTPRNDLSFDPDAPMISLSAITGIRATSTMQLWVQIGAHELTVLLDSISTHNFIRAEAARRANLPLHDSRGAHVVVGVECRGLARGVNLQISEESFRVDMYSIPVHVCDVVLGIAWLQNLGPILCNFA
jgi:hypothetical protein